MDKVKKQIIFLAAIFLFFSASSAQAASLYFSPLSGSYAVGSAFSVALKANSGGEAINAAEGTLIFNPAELAVVSISKNGSIFNLWTTEPTFSNSDGNIVFGGGTPKNFTGTAGTIITVVFKAKTSALAQMNFSSGSILAADGKGTNILASFGNAQFGLDGASPTVPISTTPTIAYGAPSAPQIYSPTHPDPNEWYAQKDAKFAWLAPSGVTGARLLVGKIPRAIPTIMYSPAINEKEIKNIDDGIWYFHVQLRNAKGWGEISHFRFQIDTKPPEPFSIKFIDGKEMENPRPTIVFDTTDSLSGIDYYKIKIGEGDFSSVSPEIVKSNPYTLPTQNPGKRSILVQAFDKAGNYTIATEEFIILPLESPIITEWPKELQSGEPLIVKGSAKYPNIQIIGWLQRQNDDAQSQTVKSDEKGNFVFVAEEKPRDGVYKFWAEAVDERGAKSLPTEKLAIAVKRSAFLQIGSWAISLLAVMVPLVALIILILFMIWYGWHKSSILKKRLRKEVREAESVLRKKFALLKENMREQISILEKTCAKRRLTEEEDKILKQFKENLDDAEKFIKKEIGDIEKEIK